MSDPRKVLGREAEQVAERYLQKKGYRILGRNWRSLYGELDLVAEQGGSVVFLEVKSRRGGGEFDPGESIHAGKQERLARLAAGYLQQHPEHAERSCRFDAVLVWKIGPFWRVELVVDAFRPGW
jgi:putative endonuclease